MDVGEGRMSASGGMTMVPPQVGGPSVVRGLGSRFTIVPLSLTLDQLLFLITAGLLCLGLVMVQSADARVRNVPVGWMGAFNSKNALHALIALAVMTGIWRTDYRVLMGRVREGAAQRILLSPATWLMVVTMGLLLAVLVTPLGRELNGARRWLALGPLGFQPSELAKLSVVLFIAAYAVHCRGQIREFGMGIVPVVLLLAAVAVVLVKQETASRLSWGAYFERVPFVAAKWSLAAVLAGTGAVLFAYRKAPTLRFSWGFLPLILAFGACLGLVVMEDFGTTVLIAAVALALLVMAGCRLWHLALLAPPALLVVYHMLNTPFRRARLGAFWNPWADSQGAGYHVVQSLLAINNGAPWGQGLGNGIQKMGYLPEDNTDFIFAVICEELGLVGAFLVIGLFAAFVVVGWRVMSRCQDMFGKMVAFGITAVIGLQAAINIAVVTGTVPTKGIALPLISSGGTGWIMNAAAIGVLMSIERANRYAVARGEIPALEARGFPVEVVGAATGGDKAAQ